MRRARGFQRYPSSESSDRAGRVRQGRKGHTEVLRGDAVEADQGGDRTTRWQCCTTSFIGWRLRGGLWEGPSRQETLRGQGALRHHLMEEEDRELPGQRGLTCPAGVTQQQGKLECAQEQQGSRVVNLMYQLDWTMGCSDFWLNMTLGVSGWD